MPLANYNFNKQIDILKLESEINSSEVSMKLDHIDFNDDTNDVVVYFKTLLLPDDLALLELIIEDHDSTPLEPDLKPLPIDLNKQSDDMDSKVPYVYPTSRPLGYLTNFAGAGDGGEGFSERGKGQEILFNMKDTDVEQVVNLTFNEDVYIKDGALTSIGAPLGAHIDIEIVHPLYGTLDLFGVKIPVLGTSRWPLDTDDRALVPKGLIIRITCRNASGTGRHDDPAAFKLAGRLELFRKKNTIV